MDTEMLSAITPEVWRRLLTAFDAGVRPESPELACHYAGISVQTWQAECERTPEFEIEARKVAASGVVSVLLMLQRVAASEWRAGLEFAKLTRPDLFGSSAARGRELLRLGEPGDEELDAEVSPADVVAVLRLLGAGAVGGQDGEREAAGEADAHPNGQHAQPEAGVDGEGGRG